MGTIGWNGFSTCATLCVLVRFYRLPDAVADPVFLLGPHRRRLPKTMICVLWTLRGRLPDALPRLQDADQKLPQKLPRKGRSGFHARVGPNTSNTRTGY